MAGIVDAFLVAGSGLQVQSDRLRVIAQNVANVDATGNSPGANPYQRKTITFKNVMDNQLGIEKVAVSSYGVDKSPFKRKFEPGHPAANGLGYVKYPNVETAIELVDMREAQRAYEANVNVIDVSRSMISQTLGLMK